MAKQLRLDPAQLTDVGRKREHNEDNMAYVIPKDPQVMAMKGALFIVADGMGGHAAGEVASEIAVDTVSNAYYIDDSEEVVPPLLQAIKRANLAIHQRAAENLLRSGMGTTCVTAVLRGNMAYIANVGDSRAYLVRGGLVRQITQDHSWVAEQVRAGLLTEEQARTHAQRNVITRCLGTQLDVDVDVFIEPLQENDCLVLCTDGLSGLISDEEVMRIVNQSVPQESVYHLVERANENGGPDNITAIVVRVQEVGVEPPGARVASHAYMGGREISEATTGTMNAMPGSAMPTMPFASSNGGVRVSSAPLHISSGPLLSPTSITAPQPALAAQRRSRLFFPTLFLVVLIVAALASGGIFYFIHSNQNSAITQTLDKAQQKIQNAQKESPAQALQDLSSAQSILKSLPQTLDSTQNNRLTTLQHQMVAQAQAAIAQYNTDNHIAVLPCRGTISSTVNVGNANAGLQPQSIVAVQNNKGPGPSLFTLGTIPGKPGSIYQIVSQSNQPSLLPILPGSATVSYLSLASGGSQLFTLAEQLKDGTPVPGSYTLTMYTLPASGAPTTAASATINGLNGFTPVPSVLAVWGTNVYVVLTNQDQGRILKFAPDGKGHLQAAPAFNFSISASIASVTAFSNQFFILYSNGQVWSIPLTQGSFPSNLPAPVLTSPGVPTPLAVTSLNSPATPVPTVTTLNQNTNVPLSVSASTPQASDALASGVVNGTPHLYLGDPTSHRVLDLVTLPGTQGSPTPTATKSTTATPAATSLIMQTVQQLLSPQQFSTLKGIAIDPQGATINILTQPDASTLSVISVSSSPQTLCASGS